MIFMVERDNRELQIIHKVKILFNVGYFMILYDECKKKMLKFFGICFFFVSVREMSWMSFLNLNDVAFGMIKI